MYTEIVLETELRYAEALSDALLDVGALSAALEDADAGGSDEEPLFGEPGSEPLHKAWRSSRIVALFKEDVQVEPLLAVAAAAAGLPELPAWTARPVADADWVRETQAQFEPIAIAERLWIVPSWHARPVEAGPGAILLKLDPGLAFGTGAHPTTRLCLNWLLENVEPADRVIDYGCGSGILAIAARKLGARAACGTDIDPQAVRASIDNARDNQCEVSFVPAEELCPGSGDIVIANILSNPLQLLAPLLASLLAPHGRLVLSGVLERQADDVISAYRPWLDLAVWRADEGWVCLAGHRRDGMPL